MKAISIIELVYKSAKTMSDVIGWFGIDIVFKGCIIALTLFAVAHIYSLLLFVGVLLLFWSVIWFLSL
jgi:hypothetical protein